MKTILWPTDLSKTSMKAAPQVMQQATASGARLVVLYVAVDLCAYFPAYGNYPSKEIVQNFQGWEIDHARQRLEAFCAEQFSECPKEVDLRLVQGDAAEQILKAIEREGADMVIMTTRGHSADKFAEAVPGLGGVADKVVARSPVHVMLINPYTEPLN